MSHAPPPRLALVAAPPRRPAGPCRRLPPKKDKASRSAVNKALAFLKNTQREDGSWSAGRGGGRNAAITGLCVMAFLSAGHVPGEGPYAETVEKGVRAVLKSQQANGLIATEGGHEMYHHGICTLMLAEVAGMTEGPLADEVRKKLEKAVAVILKAQRKATGVHRGGWRYNVNGYDTDISVTGWQVMALRAPRTSAATCRPRPSTGPSSTSSAARTRHTGGFRYMPGSRVTVACTGTSILALELCGKDQHRSQTSSRRPASSSRTRRAGAASSSPTRIYYCSQATFQLGGQYWNSYRAQMHKVLLRQQQRQWRLVRRATRSARSTAPTTPPPWPSSP